MKKMNNKGFSLVELIVVIAIMAVLIGVLAPQFIKYVEKSRQTTDIQNMDTCVSAVRAYYADKTWPDGKNIIVQIDGGVWVATNADASCLADSGCANSKGKGTWTTSPSATITSTGTVTYAGDSKYYKVENNQFVGKSTTEE